MGRCHSRFTHLRLDSSAKSREPGPSSGAMDYPLGRLASRSGSSEHGWHMERFVQLICFWEETMHKQFNPRDTTPQGVGRADFFCALPRTARAAPTRGTTTEPAAAPETSSTKSTTSSIEPGGCGSTIFKFLEAFRYQVIKQKTE